MQFDFTLNNGQVQATVNFNSDLKLAMDNNACMAIMAITTIVLAIFQPHPSVACLFIAVFAYHLLVRNNEKEEYMYSEIMRINGAIGPHSSQSSSSPSSSKYAHLAWSWAGFGTSSKGQTEGNPPLVTDVTANDIFKNVSFPFIDTFEPLVLELNRVKIAYSHLLRIALNTSNGNTIDESAIRELIHKHQSIFLKFEEISSSLVHYANGMLIAKTNLLENDNGKESDKLELERQFEDLKSDTEAASVFCSDTIADIVELACDFKKQWIIASPFLPDQPTILNDVLGHLQNISSLIRRISLFINEQETPTFEMHLEEKGQVTKCASSGDFLTKDWQTLKIIMTKYKQVSNSFSGSGWLIDLTDLILRKQSNQMRKFLKYIQIILEI
jgi:hypothetical protein